jgi:hypothetical protein
MTSKRQAIIDQFRAAAQSCLNTAQIMHVRQEAEAVAFYNPRGFGFHGPSWIRELSRPLKGWARIQLSEFKKAHAPFRALSEPAGAPGTV